MSWEWEKIMNLKIKNWKDDEDKVKNQKELNYLDWLNRVETLMSDEEKI